MSDDKAPLGEREKRAAAGGCFLGEESGRSSVAVANWAMIVPFTSQFARSPLYQSLLNVFCFIL
jgi:hypothetical protein